MADQSPGMPAVTPFEWHQPDWWQQVAPGTGRDSVAVMGLAYSLRGARAEALLEFIHGWNMSEGDLPHRAFGSYPLKANEVESFLKSAEALMPPEAAALRMTERLIALEAVMNETALALNILDVWRHCHELMPADPGHGDHCACLMNCGRMPPGIRALDEAVETYYEQHHDQPAPDCFGSSDESFRLSLRGLIRRSLDGLP
jgi:hypothetical protein